MILLLLFLTGCYAENNQFLLAKGFDGKIATGGIIDRTNSPNLIACARACSKHGGCASMFYVTPTNACQFHDQRFNTSSPGLLSSPHTKYYEIDQNASATSPVITASTLSTNSASMTAQTTNSGSMTVQTTNSVSMTAQTTNSASMTAQTTNSASMTAQTTNSASMSMTAQTTTSASMTAQTTTSASMTAQTTTAASTTTASTTSAAPTSMPLTEGDACPVSDSVFSYAQLSDGTTFKLRVFLDMPRIYNESTAWCEAQSAKLYTILTPEKMNFTLSLTSCADYSSNAFWSNGRYDGAGGFRTTDGDPVPLTSELWYPGKPNSLTPNDTCIWLYNHMNHKMDDIECDYTAVSVYAICEKN